MNNYSLEVLRHSAAHLVAHAVSELFPETILTIGPATHDGFFYDMLPQHNFKEDDLPHIQERMHEIAQRNLIITHEQITKEKAREIFKNNPYKLELIDLIPDQTVGLSRQGDFYDLCRGGHVDNTGDIKHFKLLSISGSYWRAVRTNKALQRISGTAFFTDQELKDYEKKLIDLQQYDHRRLGKQLDLFSFHDQGIGFPFFHPKGKSIINTLIQYMRELLHVRDYKEIQTPIMLTDDLWKQSGHYTHYKENMYFSCIDEKTYAIKPMNCPGAILSYNERPRSYRDLPLKLAEFGLVHRHELSGALHGLLRVRAFTQDDAHIFCTPNQIEDEITDLIKLTYQVYLRFNFQNIRVAVSTRPESSMGSNELWQKATDALKNALEKMNIPYLIQEGEGAFYGPKIDISIQDSMGREWQCSTIQVDFAQPENFDLSYIDSTGKKERPVIIHRTIYGSLERFFAIILEHFKGNLPFWLAPIQITVLTITDEQKEYAQILVDRLKKEGIRIILDKSSDPISGKIKTAQLEKIPWMIVLGKKEVEQQTITVRYHDGKQEFGLTYQQLRNNIQQHNEDQTNI